MIRILILQPQLDQSVAIAKYLKKYSDRYIIVGALEPGTSIVEGSSLYDELIVVPRDLSSISQDYDLIVPTGAESSFGEIERRGSMRIGTIRYGSENRIFFDKIESLKRVSDTGIPVPKTALSIEDINDYPVFFKQDFERGSGARGILFEREDFYRITDERGLIFQEYIDSPYTYGVGYLADEGRMIASFIHKELLSYPRPGGSGVVLTTVQDSRLTEYTRRILQNMNVSGWGLAEFKYCPKRNDYVFMEVNAKFWASLEFAFMNDPAFLRELFGVDYLERKRSGIIFMDRLG